MENKAFKINIANQESLSIIHKANCVVDGGIDFVFLPTKSIAIIYLGSSETNALGLLKEVKSKAPKLDIIYVGGLMGSAALIELFRAGLMDYLFHPVEQEDIEESIDRIQLKREQFKFNPSEFNLTKREAQVCKLLVKGLKSKDIAKHLKITPATIKVHKSRLMRKINVDTLPDLVRAALV